MWRDFQPTQQKMFLYQITEPAFNKSNYAKS